MASPDGVPLYSKFGFKAVGQVCAGHDTFTHKYVPGDEYADNWGFTSCEARGIDMQLQELEMFSGVMDGVTVYLHCTEIYPYDT